MNLARLHSRRLALLAAGLPILLLVTTGCLANGTGLIGTPGAPTETGSSRLPSLLQQLQGSGGAGLEVFGTPQSQVLAAQDVEGKDTGPTNFGTPITTVSPAATPAGSTVAGASTAGPATPTPARPNQLAPSTPTPHPSTATPTPSPVPSSPTPTATPSSPTPTPIPPTATPTPCTSHTEGNSCATPPPEGG